MNEDNINTCEHSDLPTDFFNFPLLNLLGRRSNQREFLVHIYITHYPLYNIFKLAFKFQFIRVLVILSLVLFSGLTFTLL